jgi:murein DD-endopeptidase MepM/ murein hydrolase activator NlpD
MGRKEFSRREFDAMLLGLGGTLFVGAVVGGVYDFRKGLRIGRRFRRELERWSGYRGDEEVEVVLISDMEELNMVENVTNELETSLQANVMLAEPNLTPSKMELFLRRREISNMSLEARVKNETRIKTGVEALGQREWDVDSGEALSFVVRNRPFYPAYDKGCEWRMIKGVKVGEYNKWGVHGFKIYDSVYKVWWGVDMVGLGDDLVHAPFDGIVETIQNTEWGRHIDIVSPNRVWWVRFHHMEVDQNLRQGSPVKAGQVVAREDPSSSGGKHLHMGMIFGYNRNPDNWEIMPAVATFSQQPYYTYEAGDYIDGAGYSADKLAFIEQMRNE